MSAGAGAREQDASDAVCIRFWGVRGSIPSPGPLTARYGGNTSCVSVERVASGGAPAGGSLFVLDAGSGIRQLGLDLLAAKRLPVTVRLLLTHTHWDHIQGFPFFAPAFIPGNSVNVYGAAGADAGLAEALAGQMLHRYFPVSLGQLAAGIQFHDLAPGEHVIHDVRVTMASLNHPGGAVGYRLELAGVTIAYVTDTEPGGTPASLELDENVLRLARGADVLIHDAQYTLTEYPPKAGWGHTPVEHVVDTAIAAGARRLFLFHHDPTRTDDQVDEVLALARRRAAEAGAPLIVEAAMEQRDVVLPARLPVAALA